MMTNRLIAATRQPVAKNAGGFRKASSLQWMVARMITTNSLAAFTKEVAPQRPVAEPAAIRRQAGPPIEAEQVAQRRLDAVPPAPSKPVPRGSLLDMRV
jgi:hypothetical protein